MYLKKKTLCILMALVISTAFLSPDLAPLAVLYNQNAQAATKPSSSVSKITLSVGDKNYKIKLKNISKDASVIYSSKDKDIAVVTKNGVIKPMSEGKTIVSVVIKQNGRKFTSKIKVTVKDTTTNVPTETPTPAPAVATYVAPEGSDKAAYISGLDLSKENGSYYTTTKEEYIKTTRFNLYLDKGVQVPVDVINLINYIMDEIEETTGYKFYVQHYNNDKYYWGMDAELEQYFGTAKELEKVDEKNERLDIVVANTEDNLSDAHASSDGGVFLSPDYIKLLDGRADALIHELLHVVYYQNGSSMGSVLDEGFTTYYTKQIIEKDKKLHCTVDSDSDLANYENVITEDTMENLFITYQAGQSRYKLGFRLMNYIIEEYGIDKYKELRKKVTKEIGYNYEPPMDKIAEIIKSVLSKEFFKDFAKWHEMNAARFGDEKLDKYGDWKIEYGYLYKYYGNDTNVTIPNTVTNIQPEVFMDCSSLKKVVIPDTVTLIGNGAFYDCINLTDITIPESVTSIYYCAFEGCTSLEKITIPKGITKIQMQVFSKCSSLKDINIPEGVTIIESNAFERCSSLKSIILPSTLETIGFNAFNESGIKNIIIPDNVTTIEYLAFANCQGLKKIVLPKNLKKLDKLVFYGCTSLEDITLNQGLTSIGRCAFQFCGFSEITIPDSVIELCDYAFSNCFALKRIYVPKSVTSIGDNTFYNCKNVTIYGEKGSYAETYAKSHNIKFSVTK